MVTVTQKLGKVNIKRLSSHFVQKFWVSASVANVTNANILQPKKDTYSIHIMNYHEPTDVLQNFGLDWITKHFKYIKSYFNYAQVHYHF